MAPEVASRDLIFGTASLTHALAAAGVLEQIGLDGCVDIGEGGWPATVRVHVPEDGGRSRRLAARVVADVDPTSVRLRYADARQPSVRVAAIRCHGTSVTSKGQR